MIRLFPVVFAVLIMLLLSGCGMETSTSFGLNIEDAVIVHSDPTLGLEKDGNGNLIPVDKAEFAPGDAFGMILVDVSGFKKGEDKLNYFDMDMEISGPDGSKILEKKNMLGAGGKVDLPNNTAGSPFVEFTVGEDYKSGAYRIKVTIYDKIGGGKASRSKTFTVI